MPVKNFFIQTEKSENPNNQLVKAAVSTFEKLEKKAEEQSGTGTGLVIKCTEIKDDDMKSKLEKKVKHIFATSFGNKDADSSSNEDGIGEISVPQ